MTKPLLAFDEVAEFIASLDPAKVLTFNPSPLMQRRVEELIEKQKAAEISEDEQCELRRYLALEYLISLAKAHARMRLEKEGDKLAQGADADRLTDLQKLLLLAPDMNDGEYQLIQEKRRALNQWL